MTVIPYSRELDIRNMDALPRGLNAPYLECITSHEDGVLIAMQWRRTKRVEARDNVLVAMDGNE